MGDSRHETAFLFFPRLQLLYRYIRGMGHCMLWKHNCNCKFDSPRQAFHSFAPSVNGEKEPCLAPLWKADYTLVCSLRWWMTPLRPAQSLKRAVQSHSQIASSIGVGCQQREVWLDWKPSSVVPSAIHEQEDLRDAVLDAPKATYMCTISCSLMAHSDTHLMDASSCSHEIAAHFSFQADSCNLCDWWSVNGRSL